MKKVMYRFYLDYEKEEKWINEMALQGWHLNKFSLGRFTFTKGEPGACIYRNEFLSGMSTNEKKDYLDFLKDSGITVINEFGGWVYMKKAATEGPFEIYTDSKSKIAYYQRMLNIFLLLFFVNAWLGISNVSFFNQSKTVFFNQAIGVLNIAAAFLIAVPIIKIIRRKRELKKNQQFFE
ncbi:DUF2812 domain-containing protein [Neobacillus sp. OS1-2]|uniref:DUF2812 domain-containing protein n=1 Tax=Neobacillus sp. OS1-2 TaxID=3070680 RepID=UPI0027DFD6E0|nr:DUF2812 domain-containing protein [Neobacillus sp. OS1-2]WML38122.1 DUF2812 domain-containing protein [Neobacillus sp. OS1-2]